ncbi:hypothetical protein AJ79_02912 [Helicocarpus griseus UAMH5409]|uniref:Uncharacterized protein n=1 Tax=Helicocarpus griseus UAMH5409 TaxID=1447875 RepID=A0A2B7Y1I7_9EURO|nr:hypothetical protein AJ79_02912 [Helicocarpus griseus UAMH5409]
MDSSKTITEIKASFVRSQIRILAAALTPSEDWRDYGPVCDDDIPDKTVEDVLQKFNTLLKKHNRAIFSSQAIHHVSRQIESLYWNAIDSETGGEQPPGLVVERGTDLTNSRSIARLPDEWRENYRNDAGIINEEDKARYEELRQRLLELDNRRKQQQQRLAQYKLLQELLQPFKDPQTNIQPNLVTRDSPLGQEIDRMRMLVAKVTSRVSSRGSEQQDAMTQEMGSDYDAKLAKVTASAVQVSTTTSAANSPDKFVPRHRRANRSLVSRADLLRFRAEVLGIPQPSGPGAIAAAAATEQADKAPDARDEDDELTELNLAFSNARMSFSLSMPGNNNTSTTTTTTPGTNNNSINTNTSPSSSSAGGSAGGYFPGFFDNNNPSVSSGHFAGSAMTGMSRQSPSPATPSVQNGGMGPMNVGMPVNAGHQMDLNHLYEMVLELSDVLKNNRDMTKGIIDSAEEIMKRATTEGASPTLQEANGAITAARIAELERALAREKALVEVYKREQVENTKLIGEYETAVGTMVEQIRHYCQNNNMHYLAQKRHYNNLLQAERDAHLQSRLDRDEWHAKAMRCAEMIRTAYRLRCKEDDLPTRIISGLQNEVRAYRNALGMEPEKPEEEFGWEFLKDLPPSVD